MPWLMDAIFAVAFPAVAVILDLGESGCKLVTDVVLQFVERRDLYLQLLYDSLVHVVIHFDLISSVSSRPRSGPLTWQFVIIFQN